MHKKVWCRCKVVVCQPNPIAILPCLLPSLSLLLKLSILLWSRSFTTMVTWHHNSPLFCSKKRITMKNLSLSFVIFLTSAGPLVSSCSFSCFKALKNSPCSLYSIFSVKLVTSAWDKSGLVCSSHWSCEDITANNKFKTQWSECSVTSSDLFSMSVGIEDII